MAAEIRTIPTERGVVRIALVRGDEELSQTLVVPMTLRIGRAEVRMDGIGGVATPEQHRNRGYSRRVLEAAVDYMRAGDAALSTLYGIPHYYPKFGFATIGPEYTLWLRSLDTRTALPEGITEREGCPADLPMLQGLYRAGTARAYGAVVRDDDWWVWEQLETALKARASEVRVVQRGGRVVGYAWRGSDFWWMQHLQRDTEPGLKIAEAFAADHVAADAVLAMCRRWARSLGQERCALAMPPESRVVRAAMFQDASLTIRHHDEAEFMGRVTGLTVLLQSLVPELEARWPACRTTSPGFALTIVCGSECATVIGSETGIRVEPAGGGDMVVHLDPGTMARLAMGGFPPETVLERAAVPASARPVLEGLFPQVVPYIYPADRF